MVQTQMVDRLRVVILRTYFTYKPLRRLVLEVIEL